MTIKQEALQAPDKQRLRYNAETEAAIQEAEDIVSGRVRTKSYSSFGEFLVATRTETHSDLF